MLATVLVLLSFASCDTSNCEHEFVFEKTVEDGTDVYLCTKCGTRTEQSGTKMESGIILTDSFEFVPRDDSELLKKETELVRISYLEGDYIRVGDDGYTYLSYEAPQIEKGGIAHNEGTLLRLPEELVGVSDYYKNSSGVTLRFITKAKKIKLVAKFTDAYSSDTTVQRGSFGVDVYVGAGTDKDYCGDRMQFMTALNLNETVELPGTVNEVLINLPQLACIESFEIGFVATTDAIAAPIERDRAPIAFYGGALTQGLSASRPGNSYVNTVGRMLNVDTINLGILEGADGNTSVAEYIAGIDELSAFVMELDASATLEELEANHYNFYKTVRDAHPDIPIIIMTTPTFSAEATAAAAEKREVILDTYKKALEDMDRLVYFLDANDTFPETDSLLDLYTGDMKTASDTGMYAIALGVYDVLNSAFTNDSLKSGTDRKPGNLDRLSFTPTNRNDELASGDYQTVAALDDSFKTVEGDTTFLSMSAPCFTFGGIDHPDSDGGAQGYNRVDSEEREALLKALASSISGDNITGGSGYDKGVEHLSGANLRFRTNADEITLRVVFSTQTLGRKHFSDRGALGIDVYIGSGTERYYVGDPGVSFTSTEGANPTITETIKLTDDYTEVLINLPLYGGISSIEIGFSDENAEVAPALARALDKPIVFYGASTTQGACASRPGLSSVGLFSRMTDVDVKSLAVSGLGWAEEAMAEYIAGLEMSALFLDPSSGNWPDRIWNFYEIVREAHPDIPIIYYGSIRLGDEYSATALERDPVMQEHVERARAAGDENVYYVEVIPDGAFSVDNNRDIMAVDNAHPTDLGMYYMAESLYEFFIDYILK